MVIDGADNFKIMLIVPILFIILNRESEGSMRYSKPSINVLNTAFVAFNQGSVTTPVNNLNVIGELPTSDICADYYPVDSWDLIITELAEDSNVSIQVQADNGTNYDIILAVRKQGNEETFACSDNSSNYGPAGAESLEFTPDGNAFTVFVISNQGNLTAAGYSLTVTSKNKFTLTETDDYADCWGDPQC